MVTLIESLKLVSDIDASGYARGAKEIDAANASISQSSRAAGAAVTDANQRISRSGDALSQLERQYVAGARQAQTFEAGLRRLGTVVEKDASQMERAIQVLAGMQEKFGMTANAAVLAERGWMGAARIAEILASSASRASQSQMGMAISADEMARSAAALRAQIDPLGTAQARMNAEIAEYNTLAARGAITATELAKAQELAHQRMAAATGRFAPANNNIAGSGSFQSANIAAQFQDIAVTSAMGMSPLQIALQQGTQLSSVLATMRGEGQTTAAALRAAFLSVLSPLSLVTIGVVAAGAALIQWAMSKNEVKSLDDVLQNHARTVEHLTVLYGDAAKAIEGAASSGGKAFSRAMVGLDMAGLKKQLDTQMTDVRKSLRGEDGILGRAQSIIGMGGDGGKGLIDRLKNLTGEMQNYQGAADEFLSSIRAGAPDVEGFTRNIDALYQAQLALGGGSGLVANDLMNAADALKVMGSVVVDVKSEFSKFSNPINQAVLAISEGSFRMTDFIAKIEEVGAANGMADQANKIIKLFKPLVEVTDAINGLNNAASEARRINKERFDARLLAIRAVTDEQRIASASASAGAGMQYGLERSIREENAALEERARIDEEIKRGSRDRDTQRQSDLARQQQEIDLIGKSTGEVARLQYQFEQLAAVKQEAARAGRVVTPEEIEQINAAALSIGKMTQEMERGRLQRDLLFEREQMGRNPVEQRVATAMRGLYGDDYKTQMNSYHAGLIRGNEQARVMQDELRAVGDLGKDAFMGIVEALGSAGDRGDKLISVFSGIGKQFAKLGMERLWKNIEEGRDLFSVPERTKASPVTAVTMGRELGATIAPAISQNLTSSLSTWAAAVRKIESGSYAGNYSAMGPVTKSGDRAYGAYQVMGRNIEPWTKEVLGQALSIKEFIGDRAAQDKVFFAKFGQSMDKFGNMADATSVWFTGRPLSRAGNASDGYNTAPQYLSKVQGAVDAYPGIGKAEVSAGVVDASRKLKQQDAHVQAWQNQGGGAGGFPGGDLGKALGIGSAAFGAFAGGYQSGDPLSGGISGAMGGLGLASAGLMAAGPAIVIGAVLGIVGGMIGRAKQKRQELQQAQQELENQMGAINQLIAKSTGNYLGSFQKQFSDTTDELNKAIALARKAKNTALVTELEGAMKEFFTDLSARWNRGYEGMIASMEAGKGMDGAFLSGMDAVEKMRESLVGFVNDAKFFAEANGDLAKMQEKMRNKGKAEDQILYQYRPFYDTSPGDSGYRVENTVMAGYLDLGNQMIDLGVAAWTEQGGQLYATTEELRRAAVAAGLAIDDLGKVTRAAVPPSEALADAVERARQAAIATALASIGGAKEFTAIEEAIQKMQGAAAGLPSLLADLGMSAEVAAKAIEGATAGAMGKMRQRYKDEIIASQNSHAGVSYLNELVEEQKTYERRMKDATALGVDGSYALRDLSLSIKGIVKNASLGREEVELLAKSFPELQFALKGWLSDDLAKRAVSAADAHAQVQAAYDKESGALKNMIDRLKSFADALAKFREGMKLGASSPLGPREKLEEAARQFSAMAAKARTGDEKAMSDLTGISQSYLDEARSYYASSTQYFDIWKDVDRTLADLQSEGAKSLSVAERQLKALDDSVSGILKLNDSVLSLKDALAAYQQVKTTALREQLGVLGENQIARAYETSLNRAPDTDGMAYWKNQASSGVSINDITTQISNSPEAKIRDAYKQIMGREADQAGLSHFMASGKNIDQIQADLTYAKKMGAFAAGGFHGGGLRLVGEEGPEIEATGPSRIWSASQTREILSGSGGNNAELVAELRAMRRELAAANEEIAALRKVTAAGAVKHIEVAENMAGAVNEMSSELKRATSR